MNNDIYDVPVFKSSPKVIDSLFKYNIENDYNYNNEINKNYLFKYIDVYYIYNLEPYDNLNLYKKIENKKIIQYLLLIIIILILFLTFLI